jgi:hypothetical protein
MDSESIQVACKNSDIWHNIRDQEETFMSCHRIFKSEYFADSFGADLDLMSKLCFAGAGTYWRPFSNSILLHA